MTEEIISDRNFKIYSYYSQIANRAKSAIRKQIGGLDKLQTLRHRSLWYPSDLKHLHKSTKELISRVHYYDGWFYININDSKTHISLVSEGDTAWVTFDGVHDSTEIKNYPTMMTYYGEDCIFGFERNDEGIDVPITCLDMNELSDGFLPSNYWTWTNEHHMFYKLTFM